jgi:tetratricopeptide (TPR) repeat protein
MTKETWKRLILYSTALLLLAGLAYGGFIYQAEPDVATLVSSAEILAQTGGFDQAMVNARRALEQEPDHRYAHIILAYCLGQVGEFGGSVAHYRRAVELSDPKEGKTDSLRLYLGEMLIRAGDPAGAARLAEGVLGSGENRGARFVLAAARIAEDRPDLAALQYLRCAELAPEDPDPLILQAALLETQGRLPEALVCLDQALGLAPEDPAVLLPRARVLAGLGQDEAAVEALLLVARTQAVRMQRFLFAEDALAPLRTDERLRAACPRPVPGGHDK